VANLYRADLSVANLYRADLSRANLYRADLSRANLSGANLYRADLSPQQQVWFRDDIWAVLSSAPLEVEGLLKSLKEGRVDGSTYEGDCACLVGTIANVRGCDVEKMEGLKPNASRPAEQWFMQIKRGDTPESNKAAKLAYDWISEWQQRMAAAFGK
jgi:hypothetical protein